MTFPQRVHVLLHLLIQLKTDINRYSRDDLHDNEQN
jgi:hypothetical protein